MIKFSLLLCTYEKDDPRHLRECLDSILAGSVLPDEMIIVKDGPLTKELDEVILSTAFPFDANIIPLPTNQTQGIARQTGVTAATHGWIALMDSDDICLPNRFYKQCELIGKNPKIDILGGQIAEFDMDQSQAHASRQVPIQHDEILSYVKKRNPFNAMTVMFKKELAIRSGNFQHFPGFEDYDLWVRMIKNGAMCQNLEDILVYARTGSGMYSRRRGLGYIKHEWRMQRQLFSLGITNAMQFIKNTFIRIPTRLLPKKTIESIYLKFLRSKA